MTPTNGRTIPAAGGRGNVRSAVALSGKRKEQLMHSGPLGLLLVGVILVGAIVVGGDVGTFLNMPSAVFVAGISVGLSVVARGILDTGRALRALRTLFLRARQSDVTIPNAQVLREMISYAYAAGLIGTIVGWIQMLHYAPAPSSLGHGVAVSLLTLLYAIIFSECLLRPTARRIKREMDEGDNQQVDRPRP